MTPPVPRPLITRPLIFVLGIALGVILMAGMIPIMLWVMM
jgi:hypothetical protein